MGATYGARMLHAGGCSQGWTMPDRSRSERGATMAIRPATGETPKRRADERDAAAAPSAASAFIKIQGVTKTFSAKTGRVLALQNVDFEVREHEFVSIVGPSGCGKSTLLGIVSGLTSPTRGSVTIGGIPVQGPYTNLGIVFQSDVLLDWRSVLRNVTLQCEVRRMAAEPVTRRARELLASVGLEGFEEKYPHQLSGGMRQRVAICRALVHDPPLLLMDEPFGALDALTRDQLNVDLQRLWYEARKTVLFVTHSISESIFLSDRVVVMSRRPGVVKEIITVDLPRPRPLSVRETPEFGAYVRRVRGIFVDEGVLEEQ